MECAREGTCVNIVGNVKYRRPTRVVKHKRFPLHLLRKSDNTSSDHHHHHHRCLLEGEDIQWSAQRRNTPTHLCITRLPLSLRMSPGRPQQLHEHIDNKYTIYYINKHTLHRQPIETRRDTHEHAHTSLCMTTPLDLVLATLLEQKKNKMAPFFRCFDRMVVRHPSILSAIVGHDDQTNKTNMKRPPSQTSDAIDLRDLTKYYI